MVGDEVGGGWWVVAVDGWHTYVRLAKLPFSPIKVPLLRKFTLNILSDKTINIVRSSHHGGQNMLSLLYQIVPI